MTTAQHYYYGTGRRKSSVARVRVYMENGPIIVNGKPVEPGALNHARKDVLWLGPNDDVKLFFRFRDFVGRYVIHCHNVVHEDHAMMLRFDVVD